MNPLSWGEKLKEKRMTYGVTQEKLAAEIGIAREYLNKMENGKIRPKKDVEEQILKTLERFNPNAPLDMLIDYVRIRFPTMDVAHIAEHVLKIRFDYMHAADHAFYSYEKAYYFGEIVLMTSSKAEKGVLLELKGQGCRQFECYLTAQNRSWYDFFRDCLSEDAVFKRLDLAINDKVGMLDVPFLGEKCKKEECVSVFRTFKFYGSGELVRNREENKAGMGSTLYIGSLKSEVYFCVYEKAYEQYVKNGASMEDAEVKNRFEIRLKNERAAHAVYDLVSREDPEHTAFSIINRYIRFADREDGKPRAEWRTNESWQLFLGEKRSRLKLTTKPEPYTLQKTIHWLGQQVMPSLKMVMALDKVRGTSIVEDMIQTTQLKEKHQKILKQETAKPEEVISMISTYALDHHS